MAVTYDPSQIGDNPLYRVRFELGDTVEWQGVLPNGGNLQDEEILAVLDEHGGDWVKATAALCRNLATRWARVADVSAGRVRQSASRVSQRYEEMAARYEEMAAQGEAGRYGAGIAGSLLYGNLDEDEAAL